MQEKFHTLERSLQSSENEKRACQDKIAKMKQNEQRLEADKRQLRETLEGSENRATQLELKRRALEGDLQRLQLSMNDRITENQVSIISSSSVAI